MTVGSQSGARKREGMRHARTRGGAPALGIARSRGLRAAWLATLAAVLLAFTWQSFLTQAHQHFDPGAVSAVAPAKADGAGPVHPGKQSPAEQTVCAICRALAHASPIVPPAPVALDAPAPAIFWRAAALSAGLTLARRSHAWRSRAPPRLQA